MYKKLKIKYIRLRMWCRRERRILFPSPAEVEFIRVMGGKAIVIDHITDPKNGFPFTIITSLGDILKREFIKREVRIGRCYVDFGVSTLYYRKAIEIDSKQWHRDIVKELARDEYLTQYGWLLLHIHVEGIYRNPELVQRDVLKFLAR